jgi:hypothetical protein
MPAEVTVAPGDTVTWTNTGGNHNVLFNDGSFDEPSEPSTALWVRSRPFSELGDFRYYCEAHGTPMSGMSGIVHVRMASPSPAPPAPGPTPPGEPAPDDPGPGPGTPEAPRAPFEVTLRVGDSTPAAGSRVRFFGAVRPARDGGLVLIQRRVRPSRFRTVARTRLNDARGARSTFAVRVRIARDGVFRARVPGSSDHAAGLSRTRLVNVH